MYDSTVTTMERVRSRTEKWIRMGATKQLKDSPRAAVRAEGEETLRDGLGKLRGPTRTLEAADLRHKEGQQSDDEQHK